MNMNVLSLFDGISCGKVALDRVGVECGYYASEIDKHAIAISKYNHPGIMHMGDINGWKNWDINFSKIDLILGGFPCQSWSMSGKQLGDTEPRGQLLHVMLDILQHVKYLNPGVKFLFENVKMKAEFKTYIDTLIGVDSILINSALLSAQNRNRLYWTNTDFEKHIPDRGIVLKDILESGVADRDKSYCIDASYHKGGNLRHYLNNQRRQLVFDGAIRMGQIGNGGQGQRIYSPEGKSVTLSALGGGQGAKTGLYAIAQRGRNIVDGKRCDIVGAKTEQRLETSFSEKKNEHPNNGTKR